MKFINFYQDPKLFKGDGSGLLKKCIIAVGFITVLKHTSEHMAIKFLPVSLWFISLL